MLEEIVLSHTDICEVDTPKLDHLLGDELVEVAYKPPLPYYYEEGIFDIHLI
jgi:hypothetical protein